MHTIWSKPIHNAGLMLAVSLLLINHPLPARGADAVFCVNCGNELTQLANKVSLIKQLAQQAEQLKTELNQYSDMLTNSKGMSTQLFGKALQDFETLQNLIQQSKALAFSASDLDQQYTSRYGTYSQYVSQNLKTNQFQDKYAQWSSENADNAKYALKGLGLQASQLQNDQILLEKLQGMASSVEGRNQALQVANMIAAQQVDQTMKLRELMMLQLQTQANFLATQQDQKAMQEAARRDYYHLYVPNLNGERF